MKTEHVTAVGGGALGKQQNRDRQREPLGNRARDRVGTGVAGAVEEDGPSGARRLAEERPAVDLRLGHKEAGHGRREKHDIQVAQMIGNDKPMRGGRAFHARSNAHAAHGQPGRVAHPQRAAFQCHAPAQMAEPET